MRTKVEPFIMQIQDQGEDQYTIAAEFLGDTALEVVVDPWVQITTVNMGHSGHASPLARPPEADLKSVGAFLFQMTFTGTIDELWQKAVGTLTTGAGVRIVLKLPASLTHLPWETLCDTEGGLGLLARHPQIAVVRHPVETSPRGPLPPVTPLRVLFVTAPPSQDQSTTRVDHEQAIKRALGEPKIGFGQIFGVTKKLLKGHKYLEQDLLTQATRLSLQNKLTAGQGYQIVHFLGSTENPPGGDARWLLTDPDGNPDPISATDLATILQNINVNLVLFSNLGSQPLEIQRSNHFVQTIAPLLLANGVSAVIGWDMSICDQPTLSRMGTVYQALARGEVLEAALAKLWPSNPGLAANTDKLSPIPMICVGGFEDFQLPEVHPSRLWATPVKSLRWLAATAISILSFWAALAGLTGDANLMRVARNHLPIVKCIYPYPMPPVEENTFNVAFSEFDVIDEQGTSIRHDDGRKLALYIYNRFKDDAGQLQATDTEMPTIVIRGPAQTCKIKGTEEAERNQQAGKLAAAINADILIYGTGILDTSGKTIQLSPQFHVSYRGFAENWDDVGSYGIGGDLFVESPFAPQGIRRFALSERVSALTHVAIGLSYSVRDDLAGALHHFTEAEKTGGWSQSSGGKAIIYLFLGNTNLRLASMQRRPGDYLDDAASYYKQALALKEDYARAEGGLAHVQYLQAIGNLTDQNFDWDLLEEAAQRFHALANRDDVETYINIRAKANQTLGLIYLTRASYLDVKWLPDASDHFEKVVNEYEAVVLAAQRERQNNAQLARLAGHAHAYLGLIASWQQDFNACESHLRSAIDLVTPEYQAQYYSWLGEAFVANGQIEQAIEAYEAALRITESVVDLNDAASKTDYMEMLQSLKARQSSVVDE